MLIINNKGYEIISSKIEYINSKYNKETYYSILINIELDNKGYIKLYIDKFKNKDFKEIENKKYVDIPTNLDSK